MTMIQYAIVRYVHQLREAERRRPLTADEQRFLARVKPLMRAIEHRERKA